MTTRQTFWLTLLTWPTGLLLVLAYLEIDAITPPVMVALEVLYAAGVLWLLRAWSAREDGTAVTLVASGPGLFALVGFSGPPTADEPGLMMVNTAALMVVAVALLLVAIRVVVDHRASAHVAGAVSVLVLFVVGSTLYLSNLVARLAVVLSGAAEQQAAVEDRAWVAFSYLRGLEGSPDFWAYLLVWLDLLQLTYCVTAYLCFAGLATLLRREGLVSQGAGSNIARVSTAAGVAVVLAVVIAAVLPRSADLVPAWAAFVLTIPFMTTIAPFALGVAMLRHHSTSPSTGRTGPVPR